MRVLTVNAGSTSLKVALVVDGVAREPVAFDDALVGEAPDAVAHRVVHGGDRTAPELVDDAVFDALQALTELAPLHQPPALAGLARTRAAWPMVPNVACFDTAFHATIPEAARTYALPARLRARVRVYGFHGLSHAWSVGRVRELAPDARRVVVAHLGGGQSLCAALDGRSVMTTMGFTPLDGLVMATRSGAIDPGAVLWMQDHGEPDLGRVLDTESGLLGICGTGDMRVVCERVEAGDPDAALAFAVWRHRAVAELGGCIAALGGIDALVFTGGVGEHSVAVRRAIVDAFAFLGLALAPEKDSASDTEQISSATSSTRILRIPAREDLQLAAEAEAVLA